jgi:hypothetical protein
LPVQELVAAALWWLGASSVVFDARVRWSLWADWATEHEMGQMGSAFYSFSFPFLFPEIHLLHKSIKLTHHLTLRLTA